MRRYVWCSLLLLIVCVMVSRSVFIVRSRPAPRHVEVFLDEPFPEAPAFPEPPAIRAMRPVLPTPPIPPSPSTTVMAGKRGDRNTTSITSKKTDKPSKSVVDDSAVTRQARFESKILPGDAAWNDVYDRASEWLTQELSLWHPVDRDFFTRHGLAKPEEIKGPIVDGTETHKIVLDIAVTRAAERELLEANRRHVSDDRLESAGRGMAVLTVFLGAVAGFVRLDDWTKGYYTKRLGALLGGLVLAATALIVSA
ncbi:MAG: hypothetical protein U0746_18525 [Gemmataceae bacterium]